MNKDYQKWTKVKKKLNNSGKRIARYREGNIYWTYIGENIGSEQDGKSEVFSRPAMILKGFYEKLVYVVPIGSTKNRGKYYFSIETEKVKGVLLLSQLRSVDTLRLGDFIDKIDTIILKEVKKAVATMILE